MKIVAIFAVENNSLLSVQFDKEESDEFTLLFDKWNDIEFLEQFFEDNKADLQSGFFGNISIEEAVFRTIDEAEMLEEYIRTVAQTGKVNPEESRLDLLFSSLHKNDYSIQLLQSKAYGSGRRSWLRLYAIRIAENLYVVSGGAIKLTETMNNRPHLLRELQKLKVTQHYLKEIDLLNENDYEFIEISNHDKK
jgi:hypothetical protein